MVQLKYFILTLLIFSGAKANAANITWSSASDYVDASDVSTQGTLVEAINACGTDSFVSPTVNGVTFIGETGLFDGDTDTQVFYGDVDDYQYELLLGTIDYGSETSFSIGGGLLESGKEYQVQLWFLDERGSQDSRAMVFGDGNGNLSEPVNDQYVIGTYTANGSSQTITINGTISGPHFTAYQVRDLSSPVPALSTTAGETVMSSFSVSVSFTESVTGLIAGDFDIVNGSASGVSGSGTSWSVTITPAGNGDVTVSLPAGTVTDGSGHTNIEGNSVLTTYVAPGSEQPVPTLSTATNNVTGDFTVQVDFSEDVTGLELSDFEVSGGTLSGLTGSSTSYSVLVTPNFGGDVTLSLPRNSVTDTDGDGLQNVASDELVTAYYVTVTVSSPEELLPYLVQDNVTATLSPGTFTIDSADVENTFGTPRFEFWGSNSTYDFTDVTINFSADVYTDGHSMSHVQIFGNNNVLKNLKMVDLCDVDGALSLDGGVNLVMDGVSNRVEGFHMTIKGSYPYGYGDCFGKGATWTVKHSKHSGLLVRGESNHVKNCTLIQRSYGHCIFMQAASNPTIEGCYIEGEVRTTDDMLAETSGPAFDIGFMTVWGFTLPGGYTKSLTEAGIRAYNAGNTYMDGVWYSRGTTSPTILDNTMVNTRVGVTLTHAKGTKYVAGCTAIGTERGYAIGSGIIENCYADVQHGPAFGVDYESDRGITADITIIPYVGDHYNGSRHIAYVYGSDHNLTFRGTVPYPDQALEINVGGDKRIISDIYTNVVLSADDIVINNYTGYPMILDGASSGISGHSIGVLTNNGTGNSIAMKTWGVTSNVTFYGEATQSSTSYDAIASIAIDQNTSGTWSEGSVTHTENEDQPWWRIDLINSFDISEVRIWGRTDSNSDRLSNYDVTVLDQNGQPVWTAYQSDYPDPMVSLNTGSVTGRYVMVQLRGTDPLSIAEVEIFGSELEREIQAVAHWPLDEGSGSVAHDISGNGFDGTVTNAAWATDQLGGAVDFNGSNSVIHIPSSAFSSIGSEITISMWTFGGDLQPQNNSIFYAIDSESDRILNIHLPYSNSNVYWDAGNDNGYDRINKTAVNAEFKGSWSHWVFTKNATLGEMKIYRNGELWHSGTGETRLISGITQASIGAQLSGVHYDGRIGDVKLYNVALTDGEVSTLYQDGDLHVPMIDSDMDVSGGSFNAQFHGTVGSGYRVEWTPSLTSTWETVTNISPLETSPFMFSVPTTNHAGFYRVLWQP